MIILYIVLGLLALLLILLGIAAINAVRIKAKPAEEKNSVLEGTQLDADTYAQHLSKMVQIPTISQKDVAPGEPFTKFRELIKELYPVLHEKMEYLDIPETIAYHYKSEHPENKPMLLMSHHDVVEASGKWSHPPFAGEIVDGIIWGRGTVDTKGSLCAIFEAVNKLLTEGYAFNRDVYILSTANEEVSGQGAPNMLAYFKDHGIELSVVLDEGGAVTDPPMPGLTQKFGMLGILEKGYGDYKITAKGSGGHSSTPPKNSPLARLGKFMAYMEKHDPFKMRWTPPVRSMFEQMAPFMAFPFRFLFGNLWLFSGVLKPILAKVSPDAGAMFKTTVAFTTAKGSEGYNVMPQEAYITANVRFMTHQNREYTTQVLKEVAAKFDCQVELLSGNRDASPATRTDTDTFNLVKQCVRDVFPGVESAPYVMLGGTDSRHFTAVCENVIRFAPIDITNAQRLSVHAIDENLAVDALKKAVGFYEYFIRQFN